MKYADKMEFSNIQLYEVGDMQLENLVLKALRAGANTVVVGPSGLPLVNSILQPATATKAPVVGVAITTETTVAGCATGATHMEDLDEAARFMIESAKAFGRGKLSFLDKEEFARIKELYGNMEHFQTLGKKSEEA